MNDKKTLGQFLTHPTVANFMAKLVNPKDYENIIDPACGDGEFLKQLYLLNTNTNLFGCEIDPIIIEEANKRVPNSTILLHNGLYSDCISENETDISNIVKNNFFDSIIANPPFNGLQNKVTNELILKKFQLSMKNKNIRTSQSIEILFLERFIQLLKPNGKLCMILPEGILSDERLDYLRRWCYDNFSVEAIISLPKKGVFGTAYVNAVIVCGKKNPSNNKKVFYVRDISLSDLDIIYEYMQRNNIFI